MAVPTSANLLPQVSHYTPDAICNIGCGVSNLVIENLISFFLMAQQLDRINIYECAEVHCASSLRLNLFATYVKDILSTEHKKYSNRDIEFVS